MKYMGSKRRIAKEIIPIMLKDRWQNQYFYDLFCGGGAICENIDGNVIASDYNGYVIEALKLIRDKVDKLPKNNIETNEHQYKLIRDQEYDDIITSVGYRGYFGFALSYGGKWFGGWRRDGEGKRDYVAKAYRNALKQSPKLKNIIFENKSYNEVDLKPNSIIYCDPPYFSTTDYSTNKFDYDEFYNWCIEKHNEGHKVFISEYYMPEDRFKSIWEKEISSSLTKDTGAKKGVEKLWIVK